MSLFQHRHYVAIAKTIVEIPVFATTLAEASAQKEHIIRTFTNMFEQDNPRFDRARFLAAAAGHPINGRDHP